MLFSDWFELVSDSGLSVGEFRIVLFLGMQQASRHAPFSISMSFIAMKCIMNEKTVAKCIDGLEHKGLLKIDRQKGKPSCFSLSIDYSEFYEGHATSCFYCGAINDITIDHVIPSKKGSSNQPCNLVPACISCNTKKSDRTPEEWERAAS